MHSESDIQKRLQLLLPKDYAKEYRSFRPSTNENKRLRSSLLHYCRDGRVSKSRRYRYGKTRPGPSLSRPTSTISDTSDGLPMGFWNYSQVRALPELANLSSVASSESQIINSSRLMLDGSTLPPKSCSDLVYSSEESREGAPEQSALHPGSSDLVQRRQNTPSAVSFDSLKRRLSNRASSSLQHVHSVLRLSFPSSYRSSLSWKSSWMSGRSFVQSVGSDRSSFGELVTDGLSKGEHEVWKDIIDESQIFPLHDVSSAYSFLAPRKRLCCESRDDGLSCGTCGFHNVHAQASGGAIGWTRSENKNRTDNFNNTILHYFAASGAWTYRIMTLIVMDHGINIHAKNTSGDSFLNVLDTHSHGVGGTNSLSEYVDLLKELKKRGFSFSDRDCHGQTILHALLKHSTLIKEVIFSKEVGGILQDLSELLKVLKPDLNALDNQGHNVGDQLDQVLVLGSQLPSWRKVASLVKQYRLPLTRNISFREEISLLHWEVESWLKRLKDFDLVMWIDIYGDTPLTAVLKRWKNRDEELELQRIVRKLLNLGADVHMRDRNGNTALAIAAVRGLRPCVAELLAAGAMPNSRDYGGNGIIAVAHSRMNQASKANKHEHYSRILSCVNLLADFGAKLEPTQFEEWMPATFKRS